MKSTVNFPPLSSASWARIFSAVGIEEWRKPVVTVTTNIFLGAAMAGSTTDKANKAS